MNQCLSRTPQQLIEELSHQLETDRLLLRELGSALEECPAETIFAVPTASLPAERPHAVKDATLLGLGPQPTHLASSYRA